MGLGGALPASLVQGSYSRPELWDRKGREGVGLGSALPASLVQGS